MESAALRTMVGIFRARGFDKDLELKGGSYEENRVYWWRNRVGNLARLLKKNAISKLTMENALDLYRNARTGGVQKWHVDDFRSNRLTTIRRALSYLIYGTGSLETRFTALCKKRSSYRLKWTGKDFVSTMLHVAEPNTYAIWNKVSEAGFRRLGLFPKRERGETIGRTYARFNESAKALQMECGFRDLGLVDEFLYRVAQGRIAVPSSFLPVPTSIRDSRPKAKRPPKKGPPDREDSFISRIRRRPQVIAFVKDAEDWTCQVCGTPMILPDGAYYCEVHHIRPLGGKHGGDDDSGNALCLCPNHHAEMEHGLFFIAPITRVVVHHDCTSKYHGFRLRQNQNSDSESYHSLDSRNLMYHRDKFCRWASGDEV